MSIILTYGGDKPLEIISIGERLVLVVSSEKNKQQLYGVENVSKRSRVLRPGGIWLMLSTANLILIQYKERSSGSSNIHATLWFHFSCHQDAVGCCLSTSLVMFLENPILLGQSCPPNCQRNCCTATRKYHTQIIHVWGIYRWHALTLRIHNCATFSVHMPAPWKLCAVQPAWQTERRRQCLECSSWHASWLDTSTQLETTLTLGAISLKPNQTNKKKHVKKERRL